MFILYGLSCLCDSVCLIVCVSSTHHVALSPLYSAISKCTLSLGTPDHILSTLHKQYMHIYCICRCHTNQQCAQFIVSAWGTLSHKWFYSQISRHLPLSRDHWFCNILVPRFNNGHSLEVFSNMHTFCRTFNYENQTLNKQPLLWIYIWLCARLNSIRSSYCHPYNILAMIKVYVYLFPKLEDATQYFLRFPPSKTGGCSTHYLLRFPLSQNWRMLAHYPLRFPLSQTGGCSTHYLLRFPLSQNWRMRIHYLLRFALSKTEGCAHTTL